MIARIRHIAAVVIACALAFVQAPIFPKPVTMPDGKVFDAQYYAKANPDVAAILGTKNADALYAHYKKFGAKEGRQPVCPVGENSEISPETDAAWDDAVIAETNRIRTAAGLGPLKECEADEGRPGKSGRADRCVLAHKA